MQEPQLKLKELLWEIVAKCDNGCTYCGSKENWNKKIDENDIVHIGRKIANYLKDGEINITGGDPLLVSYAAHGEITRMLKENNNMVKIIVNPKSFTKYHMNSSILDLYDLIGVSVNNSEELTKCSDYFKYDENKDKVVIITNFNTNNIWEYNYIEQYVKENNFTWQIQYTMNKSGDNILYKIGEAKNHFFSKIENSLNNKVRIVLADNLNNGKCSAGLSSCGVTYDGLVVPCLSMRSWSDDILPQGSLLNSTLKYIWEMNFSEQRFCSFKCCKDVCNSPYYNAEVISPLVKLYNDTPADMFNKIKPNFHESSTILYGVQKHISFPDKYPGYGPSMAYARRWRVF